MQELLAHFTPTNIVLVVLGVLIHALILVQQRRSASKISIKYWLKNNWVSSVMGLLSAIALLMMADDVISLMGIQAVDGGSFYKIYAFIVGYSGNSIIKHVIGMFGRAKAKKTA